LPNVADLTPFDVGNEDFKLRSNPLQEGGDDEGIIVQDISQAIQGLGGPMTRARAKKAREALNKMVTTMIEAKPTIEDL